MSGNSYRWHPGQIEFLKGRAREGASNEVIGTEIRFRYMHLPEIPPEEIARKRAELKLPVEMKHLAAMAHIKVAVEAVKVELPEASKPGKTLKPKSAQPVKRKNIATEESLYIGHEDVVSDSAAKLLLSKSKVLKKAPRQTRAEKNSKAGKVFARVSSDVRSKSTEKKVITKPEKPLVFEAIKPSTYREGTVYVHPVIGPVLYEGIHKTHSESIGTLTTMIFKEIYPTSAQNTLKILPSRVDSHNIRLPATPDFMQKVLVSIERGETTQTNNKKNPNQKLLEYKKKLESGDPVALAGMVCWAFKSVAPFISSSDGNKAIHLLAAEYAMIFETPFKEAVALFEEKSAKPTLQSLMRNIESPQESRDTEPSPSVA